MKLYINASDQKLDISFYRDSNHDLALFNDEQIINHWVNFGSLEGRIPNYECLYREWKQNDLPKNFDFEEYLYLNPDLPLTSELQCKVHYLRKGRSEFRPFSFTPFYIQETLVNFLREFKVCNEGWLDEKIEFIQIRQINKSIDEVDYPDFYVNEVDGKFFIDFYLRHFKLVLSPSKLSLVLDLYGQIFSKTKSKNISVLKSIIQIEFLEIHKFELARRDRNSDKAFQPIGGSVIHSYSEQSNLFRKFKQKTYVPINFFFRLIELVFTTKNLLVLKILRLKPKVSLICSLYDGDRFIEQFIKNLISLNKFYRCEVIIVDANSPGNENKFLSKYVKYFLNIKIIRVKERIGIYEAWNLAINQSSAPYISNVNVDDLRIYSSISKQIRALDKNNKIDVVFSNFFYSLGANSLPWVVKHIGIKSYLPTVSTHNLLDFNSPHCAPMWRRTLHNELGLFETQFQSAGDWEFWLRCAKSNKIFGKIDKPLAIYFLNPDGLSTSINSKDAREQMSIRALYVDLIQNDEKVISENV